MYSIKNLSKYYNTPQNLVLNQVSLDIPSGRIFGLLGPNGAGKTTLISIILGLIPKNSGSIHFKGHALEKCLNEARAAIGYVPQELAFYPVLSAKENLEFYAHAFGLHASKIKRQIEFCVETAGLQQYYHKKSHTYSGGLKRRLNLAIGLLNHPELLCLDEPTVGIDPQSRNFILQTIRKLNQEGMTVIYTSHYMDEVQQICDDVAIIDHGSILIKGDIKDLLRKKSTPHLRIEFATPLDEKSLSQLQHSANIKSHDEFSIQITTDQALTELSRLSPLIQQLNLEISSLNYGSLNLESLFLDLTQAGLRDSING